MFADQSSRALFPGFGAACAPLQPSFLSAPGGWGQVQGGSFLLCRKQVLAETHYLNGNCDPAIKVCSGRCRRPNPQKNSVCALSVQGEERPARCVPLSYWNGSSAPRYSILTALGWENAQGEGWHGNQKRAKESQLYVFLDSAFVGGNMLSLAHL